MMRLSSMAILVAVFGCNASVETQNGPGAGGSGGSVAQGGSTADGGSTAQGGADLGPCPESGACQSTQCGIPGNQPECTFQWECTLTEPCGEARFVRDDATQAITLETPDPARCLLEAMRDGAEGSYSWYITGSRIPGQFSTTKTLHVRPQRVTLLARYEQYDASTNWAYEGPLSLKEPAFFDSCLAETEARGIYDCLEGAMSDSCR